MAKNNRSKRIHVEFKRTMRLIDELEQTAREMQDITHGEYERAVMDIMKYWAGENAEDYYQKCMLIGGKMDRGAERYIKIAHRLREMVCKWYDAEMKVKHVIAYSSIDASSFNFGELKDMPGDFTFKS